MTEQWFENFFTGIVNDFWSKCTPPEATRAEVDFLEKNLVCPPGGLLLDVPCGNGRHSRELAARGYTMTAWDISPEFIASARASANAANVEWVCADMRELDETERFDGAFSVGNSFGYLEHGDTVRFLAAISRALKPHGRFVLGTGAVAECILPRFQKDECNQIQNIRFLESNRYLIERSCIETDYTFEWEGKKEQRQGRQFIYTFAEIQRLLKAAGLNPVGAYSSFDQQPPQFAGPEIYFVTEKGAERAQGVADVSV